MALISLFRFGIIGSLAFGVDALSTILLHHIIPMTATLIGSYLISASSAWSMNRAWTFKEQIGGKHPFQEWLHYLSGNLLGFGLNRGMTLLTYTQTHFGHNHITACLALGSLTGLLANFNISQHIVFKPQTLKSSK